MTYDGSAPEEKVFAQKLAPGYHRVRITNVIELASGDYLAILSNSSGEVAEFIPEDIRPRSKEERAQAKKRGERLSDWRFWRLVGAFDYPNAAHWEGEDKPRRTWSALGDLNAIGSSGVECWIETSEWWDAKRGQYSASVEDMRSISRHSPIQNDPGPGGSKLKEETKPEAKPSPSTEGQEVPF
jgi:hypothetical protein